MLENFGKGNYAEYGAFNREIKLLSPASVDQRRCSSIHLSRCVDCLHQDSFISSSWRHITRGHLCPCLNDFQHVFSCFSSSPPDPSGRQQHSAGRSPPRHLHAIARSAGPGAQRLRGVRLPQWQGLPLPGRECLHLPGHEQYLPVELTWEQQQ